MPAHAPEAQARCSQARCPLGEGGAAHDCLTPLAGAPRPARRRSRRRGAPGKISSSSTMRGATFPSPGSATTSDVAGSARCWSTHALALASHYGKLGCAAQHLEGVDPRLDAAWRLVGQENAEERPHRLVLLVEPFTRLAKHGYPLLLPMRTGRSKTESTRFWRANRGTAPPPTPAAPLLPCMLASTMPP